MCINHKTMEQNVQYNGFICFRNISKSFLQIVTAVFNQFWYISTFLGKASPRDWRAHMEIIRRKSLHPSWERHPKALQLRCLTVVVCNTNATYQTFIWIFPLDSYLIIWICMASVTNQHEPTCLAYQISKKLNPNLKSYRIMYDTIRIIGTS